MSWVILLGFVWDLEGVVYCCFGFFGVGWLFFVCCGCYVFCLCGGFCGGVYVCVCVCAYVCVCACVCVCVSRGRGIHYEGLLVALEWWS